MTEPRILAWYSRGAASAVATRLMLREHGDRVIPVCCDTGAEDEDNDRFQADCEQWFGRKVLVLKSAEYVDTWDVWEKTRWLAGVNGARCTGELKVVPRLDFQRPDDIHVFGYTNDARDIQRAKDLRERYFEMTIWTPLIDKGLDKAACLALVEGAGIALPRTYAMGYPNANCIPCVKATSPAYWALVRKCHPEKFERMAKLSRDLGVRLCRLKGERAFIDEIPADHPTTNPIVPACDLLCAMEGRV